MKTFYFALLISLFNGILFGQKNSKSYGSYEAKNGHVFNIGDPIYITEPYGFKNEFTAIYDNKALTNREEALFIHQNSDGQILAFSNIFRVLKIRSFTYRSDGAVIAVLDLGLGGVFNTLVDIEKAIEFDEIGNCNQMLFKSIWEKRNYITDSIAYLQYLARERVISKDLAKEYLYLFDSKKFNLIREDEFEFQKGIKETQSNINQIIQVLDTNTLYSIQFHDNVENYDFDKESFPIKWENNGTRIYSNFWEFFTPEDINKNNVKLTDLHLQFINIDSFNVLPLNMEKANAFVKYKKDESGNVDRRIYMKISFKIVGLTDGDKITEDYFMGEKYLLARIESIDFYATDSEKYIEYYHYWLNRVE